MSERRNPSLKHMQVTGKDIAAIFAPVINQTNVSIMHDALLLLSQSVETHEARLMILGALAALGHGALVPISPVETGP